MTPLVLDHLVIAVGDLDLAARNYRALFGLAPSWRGRHPAYGTANVLLRLDDTFIELVAPDPARRSVAGNSPLWLRALNDRPDRTGGGLYAVGLGTGDIAATVAAARACGLAVEEPLDGDGIDLDTGARREWTNARIDPKTTRGVRAFFIQHRSPAGALPMAQCEADPASCVRGVDHIVVASPDLDPTLQLWRDSFGLDLRRTVVCSPERTLHFLRLGATILELADVPAQGGSTSDQQREILSGASLTAWTTLRAQSIVSAPAAST
jgi:catechol 2,3-dioxygenase-like lactoylglutathione lyase family enzyme